MRVILNMAQLRRREQNFREAQAYMENEALRLMIPYVPVAKPKWHNAGALRDSGKIAEPGKIVFTNQWAHSNYYNLQHRDFRHGGNPNATALWFETMKSKHGDAILRGTAAIVGGRTR